VATNKSSGALSGDIDVPDIDVLGEESERISLLLTPDEAAASADDAQPTPEAAQPRGILSGWTLESPYWSISTNSDVLLTITYCHAWQAIPEYTSARACLGRTAEPSSLSRAFCLQTPCGTGIHLLLPLDAGPAHARHNVLPSQRRCHSASPTLGHSNASHEIAQPPIE
jgi:hypothetical protein